MLFEFSSAVIRSEAAGSLPWSMIEKFSCRKQVEQCHIGVGCISGGHPGCSPLALAILSSRQLGQKLLNILYSIPHIVFYSISNHIMLEHILS